jgi:DNA-binding transcriptional LysR family regulator
MDMNLLHLHYFYVVAREQGFTKASKVLRIQQPAISRMVRLLEDDLDLKLFEKVGRNIQLTKAGSEVFEASKKIFGAVDDLEKSIGTIKGECKGPLAIAAAEPIASHFLPKVTRTYLEKYPKVYPSVFSGPASLLLERIASGELELGLFFHLPDLSEKLEIIETKDIRFHLVVRKDLRKTKSVLETFIGSREIDDTSTRRFPTLERLKRDHPEAKIKISSNNLTAHKAMVLEGLGVSVLPEFLIRHDLRSGKLVEVFPKEKFLFQMKFIKRRTGVLSSNAVSLIGECQAAAG